MSDVVSNPISQLLALEMPRVHFDLPAEEVVRSRAFSRTFQTLTLLIVSSCVSWFILTWLRPGLVASTPSALTSGSILILACLSMIALTTWYILTSVTTLSQERLHQTWIWNKEMAIKDLAYVKLIRVRGFEWLVAPRLYVRTTMGRFAVFYAAEPRMIALFAQMKIT